MKKRILLPLVFVAGLALSCQSPDRVDYAERIRNSRPTEQHAVHSEQLTVVMRQLGILPNERLPQELEVNREQKWRREDAVRIFGEMARAAEAIPDILKDVNLPEEQKVLFRELAGNLKSSASKLQADAMRLTPEQIGRRFDALYENCHACHSRFRVLSLTTPRPSLGLE
mgnify:CR=1 FL=1